MNTVLESLLITFIQIIAADVVIAITVRLEETAKTAKENGFTHFSTTLLISPYQKHEMIKHIGEEISHKYGIGFLYRDFRPYFRDGQRIARENGIYIQKYCGCIFSEEERYLKIKI